jgi:hypothetical protein
LANIAFAIFKVNVLVGHFWNSYIGQAVGSQWGVMNQIGRAEKQSAVQLVMSMWLRERGEKLL